jgi:uncharacterized RDD family membrane protein YckC
VTQPGRQDEADYAVLTPERVSLRYDIAGIGSRGAAAIIDTFVQVLLMVVLVAAAGALVFLAERSLPGASRNDVLLTPIFIVLGIGAFLIFLGYHAMFEIAWNGQTPGKRALHLRVIRENGYPLRPGDAVVRNLIRLVDSLPSGYGVGLLAMLLNSRAKRLGDFAAGTIVVREGARRTLSQVMAQPAVTTVRVSTEDAALVRDVLSRRAALTAESRERLAGRIAEAVARRNALEPRLAELGNEGFLEELAGGDHS